MELCLQITLSKVRMDGKQFLGQDSIWVSDSGNGMGQVSHSIVGKREDHQSRPSTKRTFLIFGFGFLRTYIHEYI